MFGFLIGTASLIGLIYVLRGGRHRHHRHRHRHGSSWASFGRGMWLGRIFDELETTPDQERRIESALDELLDHARSAKAELKQSRSDIARAMRGDSYDEGLMGEVLAQSDRTLEKLRGEAVGTLGKVHAALDAEQRQRLATLIEAGPSWRVSRRHRGGPYRRCA